MNGMNNQPQGIRRRPANTAALRRIRALTAALRTSLALCADNPNVDAVHNTRTGTRRLEAALETVLRNAGHAAPKAEDPLATAIHDWERLLKKIRRAAAPVRDLDVQRKILKKLAAELPEELRTHAARLDEALHIERDELAAPLKKGAAGWAEKLQGNLAAVTQASTTHPASRRRPDAARTALDAFARLANSMLQLTAANLHDFRKGAKKARYMAEAGGEDERAGAVGTALKRLQDAIGDWHDWVMLAEEARRALDAESAALITVIEDRREQQFNDAIRLAAKLRGRLMGEWLASSPRTTRAPRSKSAKENKIG